MQTSDFSFELPAKFIAQVPAERRTRSRMLVLHRSLGTWEHRFFSDLPLFLMANDLLVLNDTRVVPARLDGRKEDTGGKVEFLFLEEVEPGMWDVLLRTSRRPQPGQVIRLLDGPYAVTLLEDGDAGRARVRVEPSASFIHFMQEHGEAPLPPYIRRKEASADLCHQDLERYQTIYATVPGAVAAPTAGLHFDQDLLSHLTGMGVKSTRITLHVGPGTFRPVKAEQVEDHIMENERYIVSQDAAQAVEAAGCQGGRVIAVGSTSVRTVESVACREGRLTPGAGRTNLFIYPPYDFKVVDAMITNFHLPQSTLLMMVCAFAGRDLVMAAYEEAKREQYRFYSYGDCMLIL